MSAMTLVALIFVFRVRRGVDYTASPIRLESPVSLKRVLSVAALFLAIQVISTLGDNVMRKAGLFGD